MKGASIATLVGTIIFFLIDGVYYGVIMADAGKEFMESIGATEPEGSTAMISYFAMELVRAGILAVVLFQRPLSGMQAATWAAVISALVSIWASFGWAMSFPQVTMSWVLMDTAIGAVIGGVVGWVMAWLYGRFR
jgi:hypothetical protein